MEPRQPLMRAHRARWGAQQRLFRYLTSFAEHTHFRDGGEQLSGATPSVLGSRAASNVPTRFNESVREFNGQVATRVFERVPPRLSRASLACASRVRVGCRMQSLQIPKPIQ